MSESHNEHEFSDDDDQSVVILEPKCENDDAHSENNSDDTSIDRLTMIHIIYEMKQDIENLKKTLESYRSETKEDLEKVVSMIRENSNEKEPNDTTDNNAVTKRLKKL
jgi:hypothetical protein